MPISSPLSPSPSLISPSLSAPPSLSLAKREEIGTVQLNQFSLEKKTALGKKNALISCLFLNGC